MATRSELEEVQSPHVHQLNTRQVAERFHDPVVFVVHDEGPAALSVAAVAELALASAQFARVGDLDDVGVGVERLEERDGLLCLFERLGGSADDEGDFFDLLDAVATSKDERREGRSSESRNDGESALILVDLDVPFAPDLGGGEHASTTAHVTECGLSEGNLENARPSAVEADIPVQIGGFLRHLHGEYGQQRDQYPRIQR